jgi:hypothetical protein
MSYAFQGKAKPLSKAELRDLLKQAVEQTPAAPDEKEDE